MQHLKSSAVALVCVSLFVQIWSAQNTSTSPTDAPIPPDKGQCVWYGQCHEDGLLTYQNCAYNGPGKPLNATVARIINQWCPHIDPSNVCCDDAQIHTMETSINSAADVLKRYPNCFFNLVKSLCELTCSPHQSKFIEVKQTKVNEQTNKTYIVAVDYYITQRYMEKTFDSCKQVTDPYTGQLSLELMCGSWGALRCNANRWFEFMHTPSPSNPLVPFRINYINSTSEKVGNFTPIDIEVTLCNESLNVSCGHTNIRVKRDIVSWAKNLAQKAFAFLKKSVNGEFAKQTGVLEYNYVNFAKKLFHSADLVNTMISDIINPLIKKMTSDKKIPELSHYAYGRV